jgi:hypothetical protein
MCKLQRSSYSSPRLGRKTKEGKREKSQPALQLDRNNVASMISKFQKKENIFLLPMPPRSAAPSKLRTPKRPFSSSPWTHLLKRLTREAARPAHGAIASSLRQSTPELEGRSWGFPGRLHSGPVLQTYTNLGHPASRKDPTPFGRFMSATLSCDMQARDRGGWNVGALGQADQLEEEDVRFLTLKEGLLRFLILLSLGVLLIEVPWRTLWLTVLANLQISP